MQKKKKKATVKKNVGNLSISQAFFNSTFPHKDNTDDDVSDFITGTETAESGETMGVSEAVRELNNLEESSLSRLNDYLESSSVAFLTAYKSPSWIKHNYKSELSEIDSKKIPRAVDKINRERNKSLLNKIRAYGYTSFKVDGRYENQERKEVSPDNPKAYTDKEESFAVVCKNNNNLETFIKRMVDLGSQYNQESILIVNAKTKDGTFYYMDGHKEEAGKSVFGVDSPFKSLVGGRPFVMESIEGPVEPNIRSRRQLENLMNGEFSVAEAIRELNQLDETTNSRILSHITGEEDWSIVSPYRSEYSEKENQERMTKLKSIVRNKYKLGFIQFISRWVEDGESFDEQSLLIPKCSSETAEKLGKEFNQSSVIVKDEKGAREICTTPFETYKEGETVRTFNISGDKPLNIQDAEEIFSKRKGGPASKPIKGSNTKPFRLKEILEVENPRPSYFQEEQKYKTVLSFEESSGTRDMNKQLSVMEALRELNEDSIEESKKYRRVNKSLFGDTKGKIKTFALISPQNPVGALGSEDEDYRKNFIEYTVNKDKYNKEKLAQLKRETLEKMIKSTGDKALQISNLSYVEVKGHYGEAEKSLMIFNLSLNDALVIARDYGQESFFFGEVGEEQSTISYYQTFNHCKSYKLVEKTRTVSDETDAEDFFSKYGMKFRINLRTFGDDVPVIENLDETISDDTTFMHRALLRKNSAEKEIICEAGLSRILQHTKDKTTFAVIGSQDKDTKEDRYQELISEIRKIAGKGNKIGYNNLEGTYTYDDGTVGVESSVIIYNISKEDALRIANKLNQESIIWKDDNFFGFLTADGKEDGELGRGISLDKEAVKSYGSKLKGKHNNAKGFVFEMLVPTNRGSNFSKQNKSKINRYKIIDM